MSPAAMKNNSNEQSSLFLAGGSSVQAGEWQQPPHIFNECGEDAALVLDASSTRDAPTAGEDLGFEDGQFFLHVGECGVSNANGTMNNTSQTQTARDEDFWFPADLFTDELNYNELPDGPEVVSQSSRADNSTIISNEVGLELFEEVPETIDVPKRKKAKIFEGESAQFSNHVHSPQPLLASWQPKVQGTEQFSSQASSFQTSHGLPMATADFDNRSSTHTSPVNINSVKVTKANQVKDLLAILCENISCDPNQSVQDLMTLRLLIIRPHLTLEEDRLLDTILVFFESYLAAGRSRPEIATMVVRDFAFHFNHQQQTYAPVTPVMCPLPPPLVSPMLQGRAGSFGFLSTQSSVSPRSSVSF